MSVTTINATASTSSPGHPYRTEAERAADLDAATAAYARLESRRAHLQQARDDLEKITTEAAPLIAAATEAVARVAQEHGGRRYTSPMMDGSTLESWTFSPPGTLSPGSTPPEYVRAVERLTALRSELRPTLDALERISVETETLRGHLSLARQRVATVRDELTRDANERTARRALLGDPPIDWPERTAQIVARLDGAGDDAASEATAPADTRGAKRRPWAR